MKTYPYFSNKGLVFVASYHGNITTGYTRLEAIIRMFRALRLK